jgi:aminoglycoside phosphotransferase (APT) family kinase protein
VEPSDVARAVAAAREIAVGLGLAVEDATLLRNSNKLAVRLLPCDVLARVAPIGTGLARFEIEIAAGLMATGSPVAALDPRVEPVAYEMDGFEASLWTYYEPVATEVEPEDFGAALHRLHEGMRTLDVRTPHFSDRVADPAQEIAKSELLTATDRDLLRSALRDLEGAVLERGAPDQLLHGEPHVGNVLSTELGPRFIDLETCCLGPVEFDLAHAPSMVDEHYPDADRGLVADCRGLVLAIVAKHRCAPGDEFPNRERALLLLLDALREGPPWPALDVVLRQLRDP